MKIAVPFENGQIFQHFGHTEQFQVFTIEDGKIKNSAIIKPNGPGHGALAGFLADIGADTLVCGGIGDGAKKALADAGITLYGGVCGNPETAVLDLLAGKLLFNPDVRCSHHDGEEGHEHSCGSHTCGSH